MPHVSRAPDPTSRPLPRAEEGAERHQPPAAPYRLSAIGYFRTARNRNAMQPLKGTSVLGAATYARTYAAPERPGAAAVASPADAGWGWLPALSVVGAAGLLA